MIMKIFVNSCGINYGTDYDGDDINYCSGDDKLWRTMTMCDADANANANADADVDCV